MEPHVFGKSTIVGVEVAVIPLVAAVERAVAVCPAVVATHSQYVTPHLDVGSHVEAESHYAVVIEAHFLAIQPHVGTLTGTLKLYEEFPVT